jgi:TetR/AcrR family tetracycline transcriptional repressor
MHMHSENRRTIIHQSLLDHQRQIVNQRLDSQRARINARFDEKKAQLEGKLTSKQEQIIAVSLELLRADGLNNLSLRDIAKRLNIQASALYWHFRNKEELVDFMAEAIMHEEFKDIQPRQTEQDWQEWLTNHMVRLRKAMLAYPDGGRVVAGAHLYPAITLGKFFESGLESLYSADIELQKARHIVMTAAYYTFGYAIEQQSSPTTEELRNNINNHPFRNRLPNLGMATEQAIRSGTSSDDDFKIGLSFIIRGADSS